MISALPWAVARGVMEAAAQRGAPVIDLARVPDAEWASALARLSSARGLVVLGCGVEPGLTEILARHLAEQLDEVDEVHIKCGGVPEHPSGPLGYKIVFGGRSLPLKPADGYAVENGKLASVPRYSGVEPVAFDGLGELEAWHEGSCHGSRLMYTNSNAHAEDDPWPGYAQSHVLKEADAEPEPIEWMAYVCRQKCVDAVLGTAVRLSDAGSRYHSPAR